MVLVLYWAIFSTMLFIKITTRKSDHWIYELLSLILIILTPLLWVAFFVLIFYK